MLLGGSMAIQHMRVNRAPKVFYKKMSALRLSLPVLVVACVLTVVAAAQVTTGTVIGTVSDASGAVLPNAQISATNTGTNLTSTAQTNSQGEYRIEFLPVGTYKVEATATGFTKSSHTGITLDVNQTLRVD